ncbi:SpoIVB peptidase [Alteribacter natronophilus]|uniref:SpoIVB peptidase n=1 Tax=Alteribacter natronophilus TaxID=2583810 RepID=UPI001FE31D88|nr:SpoIVB peptidase [Alteribacter natronophilus]
MKKGLIKKAIGAILLVVLFSAAFYPPLQQYVDTPADILFFEGQEFAVPAALDVIHSDETVEVFSQDSRTTLEGARPGSSKVQLGVAGFPLKTMNVTVLPEKKIIPGGQSIGVRVHTQGVLVVGHHLIDTEEGTKSPGEKAGVEVGDMITKMNGMQIKDMSEISAVVQKAGEENSPLKLEVKRGDRMFNTELTPEKAKGEFSYRLGLYIRDSAAGVGTLTFYDPDSKKYGALGHVISDMDTKEPLQVNDGEILSSRVTSIEKGLNGEPGEKLARFSSERKVLGDINKNSAFGIFGKLNDDVSNGSWDEPMEIGLSHQVEEGPAEILTVVNGEEVRKFSIEIVSSTIQKFPATKGMVIKVTDPELLEATGGIVQGMSGSPIIQNNRVVGAVTHVFVNDPTSGYGCHIEWMLQEAGVDLGKETKEARAS